MESTYQMFIDKEVVIHTHTHIHTQKHTMEQYSAIKRKEFESLLMRWMNLEPIIQSEVGKKEKNKYCILMHIYGIQEDGTDERIHRATVEMQTQRTYGQEQGRGSRGWDEWVEQHENIYTNICKIDSQWKFAYDLGNSNWGSVVTQRGGERWEIGGRFKREETYVHLWLIHVDV